MAHSDTLRRPFQPPTPQCAAAALDILSTAFQNHLLPHMLPTLRTFLESTDWVDREAGILALGAVAEGPFHPPRRPPSHHA